MVDDETDPVEGPFLLGFNRSVRRLKPDKDVELVIETGEQCGAARGEDAPSSWGRSEVVIAEIAGSKVQRFTCECSVIAFRPDGRAIATAGKDGIRFWNPETATPLPVYQ